MEGLGSQATLRPPLSGTQPPRLGEEHRGALGIRGLEVVQVVRAPGKVCAVGSTNAPALWLTPPLFFKKKALIIHETYRNREREKQAPCREANGELIPRPQDQDLNQRQRLNH